jgi:hypothetical protein
MSEVTMKKSHLTISLIAIAVLFIVAIIVSRHAPVPQPRGLNDFLQSFKEGAAATVIGREGQLFVFDRDLTPVKPCGINKGNTNVPETCVRDGKLVNLNSVTILVRKGPGSFLIATGGTYYQLCKCEDGFYRACTLCPSGQ